MLFSKLSVAASLLASVIAAPVENHMQRDETPNLLANRMTPDGKREAVDKDAYSLLRYSIGRREAEELDTRDEDASDSDLYPVLSQIINKKDEDS